MTDSTNADIFAADADKPQKSAPLRAADRIRQAARKLFYREGIRAIGVDEIVSQAGVTKPSLYRSFASKDELAAAYLRDYEAEFWERFEVSVAAHPGDARAQILDYFTGLSTRSAVGGYRGCGLSNAAVEYPHRGHPARQVSENNKHVLRVRLREMARQMGAADPDLLGDGLLLLLEGTYITGQIFGEETPGANLPAAAALLIDAAVGKADQEANPPLP